MIRDQTNERPEGEAARPMDRRIRHLLEKRQAMNLVEISRALVLDPAVVGESLHHLVGSGEVECLRPVAYAGADRDFYRLRRLNDRAFLWEQSYLEVGPRTAEGYTPAEFFREVRRWMDRKVLQFG